MGLLSEGEPLSWEETKKLADHIRRHGIIQFINQYHRLKDRSKDCLMWGDEVNIVHFMRGCQLSRPLPYHFLSHFHAHISLSFKGKRFSGNHTTLL